MVEHRRSALRTAAVWSALQAALQQAQPAPGGPGRGPRRVVDLGGGTGGFAVRLAESGHQVTVVDPSPDALAALGRRAAEAGVADLVTRRAGRLPPTCTGWSGESAVDLVLCHGVLEVVDDPAETLAASIAVLVPGGTLSLLVAQRPAAVLARALAGRLRRGARAAAMAARAAAVPRRFTEAEVLGLLAGLGVEDPPYLHGARVFTDLVPGRDGRR